MIIDRSARYEKLQIKSLDDSCEDSKFAKLYPEAVIAKIDTNKKIALFDMDETLIEGKFIEKLFDYAGRKDESGSFVEGSNLGEDFISLDIARKLTNIPKNIFERVAFSMQLNTGAQELITELKKRNFCVGIISDSYSIVTEILRKRVSADFSISHFLEFNNEVCIGNLNISPIMVHSKGCKLHKYCKKNILNHLKDFNVLDMTKVYFAGNGLNDICLLEAVANSVAVFPKSRSVERASSRVVYNLVEILNDWR